MLHSMLIPLDGSPLAEQMLAPATALARKLDIPVKLLRLVSSRTPVTVAAGGPAGPSEDPVLAARAYLAKTRTDLAGQGITATAEVEVVDDMAEAITGFAAAQSVGVIAMSTHGRTGPARWVQGSVAERVLHSTTVPVLLLRPREDLPPTELRRILVPLDQSPLAEQALPYARALATRLDLPVTVLYVQPPLNTSYIDPATAGWYPAYPDLIEDEERAAQGYLDEKAQQLRGGGLSADTALCFGSPALQIVEAAHTHTDTLVVMSTHGRTGLRRAILGSVAGAIVRESGVPVLLVHAE